MNIKELKYGIENGDFDNCFSIIYSDIDNAGKRFSAAADEFLKLYGDRENIRLFTAPGRTEIGGNHTDHQHGCVLTGSVNLDVIAVVSANDSGIVRIKSAGYSMDEIDLSVLYPVGSEKGRAAALIRGICSLFAEEGFDIGGFDAYTTSNVLKGSGLSSSAAFEVLISNIINGLYNSGKADAVTIAKISQAAERNFFGKPCGLLDQMASSVGGFTYADFNDPQNPKIEKIDFDMSDTGYRLCVVDTGGNHANLTEDYADITRDCKQISNALGVEFLRDASEQKFYENIASLRHSCSDRAVLRAFHFFNENKRVELQREALLSGDFEKFLEYVNASGESSYKYLQNLYPTSNASEQGLSLAIALTKRFLGGKGACRVHGGGFAGTIQCYIPSNMIMDYKKMIEAAFGEGSFVALQIRPKGGFEITK